MFGIDAVAGLAKKGMDAWTADDERDHARQMAKIESRDVWTRRLSAVVLFAPLVVGYISPSHGLGMVEVLDSYPKWYTAALGSVLAAIWGKAEIGSALRDRDRAKAKRQATEPEPADADNNPSGRYE